MIGRAGRGCNGAVIVIMQGLMKKRGKTAVISIAALGVLLILASTIAFRSQILELAYRLHWLQREDDYYYQVQKGDTLTGIAKRLLGGAEKVTALEAANPTLRYETLREGARLRIPRK